ncbi:hypothetical protein [Hahella ganghwensis]|uniref:hypothetical protein n=1 Tax=Hahella ganghwensis TaxID=286420 RepID=UPI000372A928|nr:hypothetical protein [Hahella ganghwensis]
MEYQCKFIGVLFLAAALAGCGGGGGDENGQSGGRVENLTLKASDANPGSYILNDRKITQIRKLIPLNDGGSYIFGHSESKLRSGNPRSFMIRLDEHQNILNTRYQKDGYMDACIHPSGEISLAELTKVEEGLFGVTLKRYTNEGVLVHKTVLKDEFAEHEYKFMTRTIWEQKGYQIDNFSERDPDPNHEVRYSSGVHASSYVRYQTVKLTCDKERLIAFLNHDGPKVTVYDSRLQKEWSEPLTIYEAENSLFRDRPYSVVTVDDAGNIYGISEIQQGSIPNYNHRFHTKLDFDIDDPNKLDLILRKFSRNGKLLEEKILGSEEDDRIMDAVVLNGVLYAVANSELKKSDVVREWDIGLFSIDPISLDFEHQFLDLNQEDWVTGMTVDGDDLYLFGVTGYQQANTESIVSGGHGFYKRLPDGVARDNDYVKIAGKRHGTIHDMTVFQGEIKAVGVTDAPVTHTQDKHSSGLFYRSGI